MGPRIVYGDGQGSKVPNISGDYAKVVNLCSPCNQAIGQTNVVSGTLGNGLKLGCLLGFFSSEGDDAISITGQNGQNRIV